MALDNDFSHFMIGGVNSGSGKTTVTLGLLRALKRRGLPVAPFKCGPDYIDPLLHRQAAGRASINLDGFFGNLDSYRPYASSARAALIEGVMGLYDGIGSESFSGSSAEVAATLNIPVVLVVNARGIAGSIAPLIHGFNSWCEEIRVIGVIANNTGSEYHAQLLGEALDKAGLPPLLGALKRDERWTLPERHLGLDTAKLDEQWLDALAQEIEASIDIDRLLNLSRSKRPAHANTENFPPPRLRLGLASDEAFCFYYQENLDLLRREGVEIIPFSPLADTTLPENLNGLYLGGGYPELYAATLAANTPMLDAIRQFAAEHFVYGECGGYLYLLQAIRDLDGHRHELLKLLPGEARMNSRLAALGYRQLSGKWGACRGHEFHYSSLISTPTLESSPLWDEACSVRGAAAPAGSIRGRIAGSYVHLHFASSPGVVEQFIEELSS